jgi:expansin (peptidoglycan-binding protein)
MIVDQCPAATEEWCRPFSNDISLSPDAFAELNVVGNVYIPVEWQYTPCEGEGFESLSYYFEEAANPYWFSVQVRGHRNAVASVEVLVEGEWRQAARQDSNYWVIDQCCGDGPFNLRVTDIYGNIVENDGIDLSPGEEVAGDGQFPAC